MIKQQQVKTAAMIVTSNSGMAGWMKNRKASFAKISFGIQSGVCNGRINYRILICFFFNRRDSISMLRVARCFKWQLVVFIIVVICRVMAGVMKLQKAGKSD